MMTTYEEEDGWNDCLVEQRQGGFRLVEFVSRSGGKGIKRREREVGFVKKGERTYFRVNKGGLIPVRSNHRMVLIDDLLEATETLNGDDALEALRRRR